MFAYLGNFLVILLAKFKINLGKTWLYLVAFTNQYNIQGNVLWRFLGLFLHTAFLPMFTLPYVHSYIIFEYFSLVSYEKENKIIQNPICLFRFSFPTFPWFILLFNSFLSTGSYMAKCHKEKPISFEIDYVYFQHGVKSKVFGINASIFVQKV